MRTSSDEKNALSLLKKVQPITFTTIKESCIKELSNRISEQQAKKTKEDIAFLHKVSQDIKSSNSESDLRKIMLEYTKSYTEKHLTPEIATTLGYCLLMIDIFNKQNSSR